MRFTLCSPTNLIGQISKNNAPITRSKQESNASGDSKYKQLGNSDGRKNNLKSSYRILYNSTRRIKNIIYRKKELKKSSICVTKTKESENPFQNSEKSSHQNKNTCDKEA